MIRFISFFMILFTMILVCCSLQEESFISEEIFIPLYAKILIINQLDLDKEYHDILIEELLQEYKVKIKEIQKTIEYYQNNPDLWVKTLEKIKDHLTELKKNRKPDIKISEKMIDKR